MYKNFEISVMGLKRNVIISIYYMSNDLTFEILYIILQKCYRC